MSLFGTLFATSHEDTTAGSIDTPLDLVMRAAGLVSNPQDIDPNLDQVRTITARLNPGESLPPEDEKVLFSVYKEIEDYLITKEPLRSFTQDALRARIAPDLKARLESYEAGQPAKVAA